MLRSASLALAAAAVLAIVLVGAGRTMRPPEVGPPPVSIIPSPPPGSIIPSPPAASATEGEVVWGWPDTDTNGAGVYSWDGATCGRNGGSYCSVGPTGGFMHNGYGSGDVTIHLNVVPGRATYDGDWTAATVAGHDGNYRRIGDLGEEWVVEIEGTTIAIRLSARPGTSQTDMADAHAIIDSMRAEPRDNDLGFRLVFTLTTDVWDSG